MVLAVLLNGIDITSRVNSVSNPSTKLSAIPSWSFTVLDVDGSLLNSYVDTDEILDLLWGEIKFKSVQLIDTTNNVCLFNGRVKNTIFEHSKLQVYCDGKSIVLTDKTIPGEDGDTLLYQGTVTNVNYSDSRSLLEEILASDFADEAAPTGDGTFNDAVVNEDEDGDKYITSDDGIDEDFSYEPPADYTGDVANQVDIMIKPYSGLQQITIKFYSSTDLILDFRYINLVNKFIYANGVYFPTDINNKRITFDFETTQVKISVDGSVKLTVDLFNAFDEIEQILFDNNTSEDYALKLLYLKMYIDEGETTVLTVVDEEGDAFTWDVNGLTDYGVLLEDKTEITEIEWSIDERTITNQTSDSDDYAEFNTYTSVNTDDDNVHALGFHGVNDPPDYFVLWTRMEYQFNGTNIANDKTIAKFELEYDFSVGVWDRDDDAHRELRTRLEIYNYETGLWERILQNMLVTDVSIPPQDRGTKLKSKITFTVDCNNYFTDGGTYWEDLKIRIEVTPSRQYPYVTVDDMSHLYIGRYFNLKISHQSGDFLSGNTPILENAASTLTFSSSFVNYQEMSVGDAFIIGIKSSDLLETLLGKLNILLNISPNLTQYIAEDLTAKSYQSMLNYVCHLNGTYWFEVFSNRGSYIWVPSGGNFPNFKLLLDIDLSSVEVGELPTQYGTWSEERGGMTTGTADIQYLTDVGNIIETEDKNDGSVECRYRPINFNGYFEVDVYIADIAVLGNMIELADSADNPAIRVIFTGDGAGGIVAGLGLTLITTFDIDLAAETWINVKIHCDHANDLFSVFVNDILCVEDQAMFAAYTTAGNGPYRWSLWTDYSAAASTYWKGIRIGFSSIYTPISPSNIEWNWQIEKSSSEFGSVKVYGNGVEFTFDIVGSESPREYPIIDDSVSDYASAKALATAQIARLNGKTDSVFAKVNPANYYKMQCGCRYPVSMTNPTYTGDLPLRRLDLTLDFPRGVSQAECYLGLGETPPEEHFANIIKSISQEARNANNKRINKYAGPLSGKTIVNTVSNSVAVIPTGKAIATLYPPIGAANHIYVPCVFYGHSAAAKTVISSDGRITNVDGTDQYWFFKLPHPTNLPDGKKLYVDGMRIGVYDADAGDRVQTKDVFGVNYDGNTTLYNQAAGTDDIAAQEEWTADIAGWGAADDCSSYRSVIVRLYMNLTNANDMDLTDVELRIYYT